MCTRLYLPTISTDAPRKWWKRHECSLPLSGYCGLALIKDRYRRLVPKVLAAKKKTRLVDAVLPTSLGHPRAGSGKRTCRTKNWRGHLCVFASFHLTGVNDVWSMEAVRSMYSRKGPDPSAGSVRRWRSSFCNSGLVQMGVLI
ncbi:hypothetical protein K402DRAFT_127453 [Aulographum hederae CBS 113979]|uniref:Uncharacterized protein n=1 Tax=Aulographum hederae CBS 113979 TaxID=1176131 RepID=A0A6G1HEN8_9PEZI|nr:hypothetical protein K402DRAFT_127453 [Aulographum hederae CBS 113979]